MSLVPGARFGRYRIAVMIGVGGMGDVYRARDTTLDRDVAIKVLPESFAADGEHNVRFEREAKALAALNHPNIAQIYGLDRADGVHALVMELVEGPTLADRIEQGPLPPDEALRIAAQIADALEAAHERGIAHRDLKPANIKLRLDGTVKVLDFGIAKALDSRATTGPGPAALTTPALTQAGVVLGTPAYASPEQALGRAVDQRTDIWAFGCVLYEMLTGRSAFLGDDATTTLARVLEREPDLNALPSAIAPAVRRTIALCLQKDPRNRIADIRDVKLAIAGVFDAGPDGAVLAVASARRRRALSYVAAAVFGGALVALLAWAGRPTPAPRPVLSFATMIPDEYRPSQPMVAIARDGSRLGFMTARGPVVRNVGDLALQPVPAAPEAGAGPGKPCFSPDATWIAYGAQNGTQLKKAPLAGGAALTLTSGITGGSSVDCDWGEDGEVYFTSAAGLTRVAESGGRPELLAAVDRADFDNWGSPQLLPDHRLLFTAHTTGGEFRAYVLNLGTREKTLVLENAGPTRYAPTGPRATRGHLVYGLDGTLFAVPLDLRSLETGAPSAVLNGMASVYLFSFADVSSTGTLAYFKASADDRGTGAVLTWVDRAGNQVELPNERQNVTSLALSPDGHRAAMSILDFRGKVADIWIYEMEGGRLTRLTFAGWNRAPLWTPDGQRIIYWSSAGAGAAGELRSVAADNSTPPVTIAAVEGDPTSISSDGRLILGESAGDVWVLPVGHAAPGASPAFSSVLATTFNEHDAMFSPDGRWIAYASDDTGRDEVYVVPYPGPGPKSRISNDGGRAPRWHPNGRELFYVSAGRLIAVSVDTTPSFHAQSPRVLFSAPALLTATPFGAIAYSVAPDGARFLMLKQAGAAGNAAEPRELRTIVNWFEELRRLAPAR